MATSSTEIGRGFRSPPSRWLKAAWRRVRGDAPALEFYCLAACLMLFPAIAVGALPSYYWSVTDIDPWIYTGLIHNYDEIVDRFGPTYYAARIAHIYPSIFFNALFGEDLGFYAVRYVAAGAATLAAYLFGARLYSRPVGLAGAAIVAFSPWFLMGFSSDLYNGTAAAYLLLAYVSALIPTRRKAAAHFAAGAFLGLSSHVVQLSFGVFGTIAPAWFIAHRGLPAKRQALAIAAGAAGFVAAYGGMMILLGLTNPRWAEGDPTFSVIASLFSGSAATWHLPLSTIVQKEKYYSLGLMIVGAFLAALALLNRSDMRSRFLFVVACGLVAILPLVFYLWRHLSDHGVLAHTFTLTLLFPPLAVASICALGELTAALSERTRAAISLSIAALMLFAWIALPLGAIEAMDALDFNGYVAIAALALISTLALLVLKRRIAAAMVGAFLCLFSLFAPYQDVEFYYFRDPSAHGGVGWDVRRGADFLIDAVSAASPHEHGPIGFWYSNQSTPLSAMQSAYLWGYSRIMPTEGQGMPVFDEVTLQTISKFSRLALLAETEAGVDEGLKAAASYAEQSSQLAITIDRGAYGGRVWGYHYAIVEFAAPPAPPPAITGDTIAFLELSTMTSHDDWSPARVAHAADEVLIESHPSNGGFSAQIDLPENVREQGPGVVRVWMRVRTGQFLVWAIGLGDASIARHPHIGVPRSPHDVLIEIPLEDLAAPTSILFANGGSGPSVATVRAIEVARP